MKNRLLPSLMVLSAVAVSLLMPMTAQAHRQWLLPASAQTDHREGWITIDAAVSEDLFNFDTNALDLDGLTIVGAAGQVEPQNLFKGKTRSAFDLQLPKEGTYRVSKVNESVMANYKLNGEAKRWRGTEDKLKQEIPADAKELSITRTVARLETYVSRGTPDTAVLKAAGKGLEILPLTQPAELFAGEKASFRVLLEGQPVAGQVVAIVPGGVRYRGVLNEVTATTDSKGEFSVNWAAPGMYWLNASYPRMPEVAPGAPRPEMPPKRFSTAVTLEVMPQ